MKTRFTMICITLLAIALSARAADVMTVAVFDFESKDEAVRDLGPKVASLINAQLSADPRLITVERAELDKALGEQELGLSGTVDPETAAKVGHLTGAKVLVTGRVFNVGRETMIVAKVIGTETSRVYGDVVRGAAGSDSIADMSADMARRIAKIVSDKADTLVAKVEKPEDLIARLQPLVHDKKLPTVSVSIAERHIGSPTIDPATETEISFILQKLGFNLADKKDPLAKADIEITGEAFSEFGMRKGNLVSCKGRVELKAIDKVTGKVLFIDRQTTVAVDLSEHLAGKSALQDAGAKLTERMLPKLLPVKSLSIALAISIIGGSATMAATTRVAVVDLGTQPVPTAFMDLLLVELTKEPAVALLERDQIEKLLREQSLGLTLSGADAV